MERECGDDGATVVRFFILDLHSTRHEEEEGLRSHEGSVNNRRRRRVIKHKDLKARRLCPS